MLVRREQRRRTDFQQLTVTSNQKFKVMKIRQRYLTQKRDAPKRMKKTETVARRSSRRDGDGRWEKKKATGSSHQGTDLDTPLRYFIHTVRPQLIFASVTVRDLHDHDDLQNVHTHLHTALQSHSTKKLEWQCSSTRLHRRVSGSHLARLSSNTRCEKKVGTGERARVSARASFVTIIMIM